MNGNTVASIISVAAATIILSGCGGGGGSSSDAAPAPTVMTTPTTQQRIDAATNTVGHNAACTTITPFYWEIGDVAGVLASGTGGDNSTAAPNAATSMEIASASKWIFGAYALEQTPYAQIKGANNISYLNFTSGYDNMGTACVLATSVGVCFNAISIKGGHNSDFHSADVGKFYYSSGHLQAYATNIAGLGLYFDSDSGGTPLLATAIRSLIGQDIVLTYSNPTLAGGIVTTASNYAIFLRKILNASLQMSNYLDADKICAWTNLGDCDALRSPINQTETGATNDISNEKWHYSIAHWVEDDPSAGDGAYSSPGLFGFYPWIDKSKTYYGVVARHDINIAPADPKKAPYTTSVNCGRLIRKAWLQAATQ